MRTAPLLFQASVYLVSFACSSRTSQALVDRCRALGDGALASREVSVHVGSIVGHGTLTAGRVPRCEDVPGATAVFIAATERVADLPSSLRVSRVAIHHVPRLPAGARPLIDLEMHRPTGALLAGSGPIVPAIWFHELAHVRMRGTRPAAIVAGRIVDAAEEGVADYTAAAVTGSSQLPGRDLTAPPRALPDDWATLASGDFDPHRLGWQLAAALWASEPRPGPLLEDALACIAGAPEGSVGDRTGTALAAWLAGCPPRSRRAISEVICRWLPAEISGQLVGC